MCTPFGHKPEWWLWRFLIAAFRTPVQLVENRGYILVWLQAFFSSSRLLSAKEKKKWTLYIFLRHRFIFPSCKTDIELFDFCPRDLACSMTGDWLSWKMPFTLTLNMWLCDSQGSLIRNWEMTSKEIFLLDTFSNVRAGPSLSF